MHKLGNFTAAHYPSMFVEIAHVRTWPQVEVIKGVVHFRQMRLPCPQSAPTPSRLPSPAALTTNLARAPAVLRLLLLLLLRLSSGVWRAWRGRRGGTVPCGLWVRAAPLYLLLRAEKESIRVPCSHLGSTWRVLGTDTCTYAYLLHRTDIVHDFLGKLKIGIEK